jgi:hypothetical protein
MSELTKFRLAAFIIVMIAALLYLVLGFAL